MVDDQDRCEWVNVSSGSGSPGQSRKKGHETVVVVLLFQGDWRNCGVPCTSAATVRPTARMSRYLVFRSVHGWICLGGGVEGLTPGHMADPH